MPQFYFHIQKPGEPLMKDDERIDLADHDAVREEALGAARDLIAGAAKEGRDAKEDALRVPTLRGTSNGCLVC
jgi:uncharacterized protein DUF6894